MAAIRGTRRARNLGAERSGVLPVELRLKTAGDRPLGRETFVRTVIRSDDDPGGRTARPPRGSSCRGQGTRREGPGASATFDTGRGARDRHDVGRAGAPAAARRTGTRTGPKGRQPAPRGPPGVPGTGIASRTGSRVEDRRKPVGLASRRLPRTAGRTRTGRPGRNRAAAEAGAHRDRRRPDRPPGGEPHGNRVAQWCGARRYAGGRTTAGARSALAWRCGPRPKVLDKVVSSRQRESVGRTLVGPGCAGVAHLWPGAARLAQRVGRAPRVDLGLPGSRWVSCSSRRRCCATSACRAGPPGQCDR